MPFQPQTSKASSRTRFKKTVFSNGLTLVTEQLRGVQSLSIGIWVKVGTRHEKGREAGVSHFLEHMLFKGTDHRTALDIAREVDRVGGDFNAFTTREYTCFHILLLGRDLKLGLDILGDVLLNSNFAADELERERKVILQEVSMVDESPEELAHDLFSELTYGKHGLGRSILGSASSIRRMSRAELLRFFRYHYRPDQLVVAVSGNITHATARKHLKALARKNWPGRPLLTKSARARRRKPSLSSPSVPVRKGFWWVRRDSEQVHLVWGVAGPPYASKDRFAAFLLNVYLGGGMSSALFQEIREKNGLAYTVYSSLTPYVDSGLFQIYAATGPKQVALCLKLIEDCVQKLKRDLLPESELDMIKNNFKGSVLLASDDVESRMSSIAKNEMIFGRYVSVEEVIRQIEAVTAQDIRRVARRLLASDARSIVAIGPAPTREVVKKYRPTKLKR